MVYDVDSAHVMFRVAGRLLPYAFGIVLFVGLAFLPRFLGMIYAVVTSVLFGMGVRYWVGHVRKTQLLALQTICQAQETSVFRKQGFALECDFVFNVGGRLPFAFCLYIIPFSQRYNASASTNGKSPTKNTGVLSSLSEYGNGYRRIELYNDGLKNIVKESSFDPISYTAGPSSPTLYSPISSESQDDGFWSQFWLDMSRAADAKRFAFRLSFVVACLLGGVLVIITGVVLFDAPVPESIALPFVICATFFSIIVCIICTCMLQSAVNVERRLVNLYAAAVLRRNGLHMEHRSIYGFGDTGGLFHIHYLYIFPIVDRHDSATLFVESN